MNRLSLIRRCLLLLVANASLTFGQATVRVGGTAFDSVSGRGLPAAFITLGSQSTTSDSLGHFTIDSVAPGTYRLAMQHDVLDSLGLGGIMTSVVVKGPTDGLFISTPSTRTMWRHVCPGEQPRDSGFVFGVVRDATHRPVAGAAITVRWADLASAGKSITQKGWRLDTKTAADGSYVVCGMPVGTGASVEALRDSAAGAAIELMLTDKSSVGRYDLTLTNLIDSTARGTIKGTVTADGRPVSNVHLETDGMPEVVTSTDGAFVFRNVRAGTRQLYVQGIGFTPTTRLIEVAANDTARVSITVGRTTMLDSVRVVAPTARTRLADQFRDRQRLGIGYFRDSTQIGKYLSLEGVFATMPSVKTQRPYGGPLSITIGGSRARGIQQSSACQALIFVDRVRSDAERLEALRPSDIAAIEVYRVGEMPGDLAVQFGLNPFIKPCAVVAWTKLGWH